MYRTTLTNPVPGFTRSRSTALTSFTLCSDGTASGECSRRSDRAQGAPQASNGQPKLRAPTRWTGRRNLISSKTEKTEWLRHTLNDPKNMFLAAMVGLTAGMLLANLLSLFIPKENASLLVGWTMLILAALTPVAAIRRPEWLAAAAAVPPRLRGALSHISAVMGR